MASAQRITVDGSLGPAQTLTGPNYAVGANLGRQVGGNLFHSFGAFGLNRGETATFSGPPTVANVVGRVTGGAASSIDGTVRSAIPGANLFLINPAGVVFGPNAQVSVTGAFHASSADYLRLADGARFQATNPGGSTLTSAPPAAFGFLSPSPRPVAVSGGTLAAAPGAALGLVGGSVTISGGVVQAPAGTVHLAGVGGAGEVAVDPRAGPSPAAARSGPVVVTNGARIETGDTSRRRSGGGVFVRGSDVTIAAASDVSADNHGPGGGGVLSLRADGSLTISGRASVHARTLAAGTGSTIDIGTAAGGSVLVDRAEISADTSGPGTGGSIRLSAGSLAVVAGGAIRAGTSRGGNSGGIAVTLTGPLTVDGSAATGLEQTEISAAALPGSTGDAGGITVTAGDITLWNNGQIESTTLGRGPGGNVAVTAHGTLTMAGPAAPQARGVTGIGAQTGASDESPSGRIRNTGASGRIVVQAGDIIIGPAAAIAATTFGQGDAQSVSVRAENSLVLDTALFGGSLNPEQFPSVIAAASRAGAAGNAGSVTVDARDIALMDDSTIASTAAGSGRGGDVVVTARGTLAIARRPGASDGPTISVRAGAGSSGDAGTITVVSQGALTLSGSTSGIVAATAGSGDGGSVTVRAPQITLLGGASITSNARAAGTGAGGAVTVTTPGALLLDGQGLTGAGGTASTQISASAIGARAGDAGPVTVSAGTITLRGGQITSRTGGAGRGGNVAVTAAGEILLEGEGSQINSSAVGSGDAGSVAVSALRLRLRDEARISTEALASEGGDITLTVRDLIHLQRSAITTSVRGAQGSGGNISIDPRFIVLDSSFIRANAVGGNGGNIRIRVGQLVRSPDSEITASSQLGISGNVEISGPQPNLNASLAVLASELRAAVAVLHEGCAARGASPRSSLALASPGGIRQDPQTSLPALWIADRPVRGARAARAAPAANAAQPRVGRTRVQLSMGCG